MTEQLTTHIRTAKILMALAAASAALAGAGAISTVTSANDSALVVEIWRMIGFFTFAALFGILARHPQGNRSLWLVVIANKLALTIVGLFLIGNASITGASDLIIFDGALTLILLVSSFLTGVWKR